MNLDEARQLLVGGRTIRDLVVEPGPSSIDGCRRREWLRLKGAPQPNAEAKLAAVLGQMLHKHMERRLDQIDPWSMRYLREVEVEAEGVRGHIDCFDLAEGQVIDWKSTVKRNLVSDDWPRESALSQAHVYGLLLHRQEGVEVKSVAICGIPRDGTESGMTWHAEEYSEKRALDGLAWLQSVRDEPEPGPWPEKSARYCQSYCPFFGGLCQGR